MDPIPKDRWLRSESPLEVLGERLATLALEPQSAAALAEAVRRFLRPSPPFAAGPVLAAGGVTAAIDVSDGLSSEVDWIAQESGVGIVIDADRIPVGAGARAWAAYRGLDPLSLAFGGGEDYELLFTVPERSWSALERKLLGMEIRVAAIGQVTTESEGVTCRGADGFRRPLPDPGYEHFGRRPEPA